MPKPKPPTISRYGWSLANDSSSPTGFWPHLMTDKCVRRKLFPFLVFSLARGAEVRVDTDTANYRGQISAMTGMLRRGS